MRHGTTDPFAAPDVKAGRVIGACRPRHRGPEFRAFPARIAADLPADLDVHLILADAAAHKARLIRDRLAKRPRYHVHLTPTPASWLNPVESWFALLTARQLKRGAFRSTGELAEAIRRSIAATNAAPKPFRVDQAGRRDPRRASPAPVRVLLTQSTRAVCRLVQRRSGLG